MVPRDKIVLYIFIALLLMIMMVVLSVVSFFDTGFWQTSTVSREIAGFVGAAQDQLGTQLGTQIGTIGDEAQENAEIESVENEQTIGEADDNIEGPVPESLGIIDYPVVRIENTESIFAEVEPTEEIE